MKTAVRRPNPLGRRPLRRISALLVVADALWHRLLLPPGSARQGQPARPRPVFQQAPSVPSQKLVSQRTALFVLRVDSRKEDTHAKRSPHSEIGSESAGTIEA